MAYAMQIKKTEPRLPGICPPSCTASQALTLKLISSSAPELRLPTLHHRTLSTSGRSC